MLKVLTKSVNEHEDFMNNCVNNYIEELSKEFSNTYIKKDSRINDLEKGYVKFSKSVYDYIEFKNYCKQIASMKNINNLYDLYYNSVKDKQKFTTFCEKVNSYFAKENQLDLNCNLYKVYFEDHYYIMINIFN